jgi:hypothetical protein
MTNQKKVKVAPPMPYDGTAKKFETFITSLHLVFGADPKTYEDPKTRIYYTMSYMQEGAAQRWVKNMLDDIHEGRRDWSTWKDFEDELKEHFETENKKDDAQMALESLSQSGRTAEVFFDIFEGYKRDTGYNDEAFIHILKKNLDTCLLSDIYRQTPLPVTFDDWKKIAIQKDCQY